MTGSLILSGGLQQRSHRVILAVDSRNEGLLMQRVVIDGERVRLRDWALHDLEAFAHWLHPGHRWRDLDGPYYAKPTP